jgi:hypothetical protein
MQETSVACQRQLSEVDANLSSCRKRVEEVTSLLEEEKKTIEELQSTLNRLEKDEKGLRSRMESDKKQCSSKLASMEARIRQEDKSRTETMESLTKELDQLRNAWLPVWLSERVIEMEKVFGPMISRSLAAVKPLMTSLQRHVIRAWQDHALPSMIQVSNQSINIGSKAICSVKKSVSHAWRKHIPSKYRRIVSSYGNRLTKLINNTRPIFLRYWKRIKVQASLAASELEGIIRDVARKYPEQLSWAAQGSRPQMISIFIMCFPFIVVGMPLLASKMQKSRSITPKKKATGRKKKSSK